MRVSHDLTLVPILPAPACACPLVPLPAANFPLSCAFVVDTSYTQTPRWDNEDAAPWFVLFLFPIFSRVNYLGSCPGRFIRAAMQSIFAEMVVNVLAAVQRCATGTSTDSESREAVTSFIDARNLTGLAFRAIGLV
jgi:hypothetical protein